MAELGEYPATIDGVEFAAYGLSGKGALTLHLVGQCKFCGRAVITPPIVDFAHLGQFLEEYPKLEVDDGVHRCYAASILTPTDSAPEEGDPLEFDGSGQRLLEALREIIREERA